MDDTFSVIFLIMNTKHWIFIKGKSNLQRAITFKTLMEERLIFHMEDKKERERKLKQGYKFAELIVKHIL